MKLELIGLLEYLRLPAADAGREYSWEGFLHRQKNIIWTNALFLVKYLNEKMEILYPHESFGGDLADHAFFLAPAGRLPTSFTLPRKLIPLLKWRAGP